MSDSRPSLFDRWHWPIVIAFWAVAPLWAWGAHMAEQTNNNDVEQWLPSDFDASRKYRWFYDHFGTDAFVVVSWEGCTLEDERLSRYANALRRYVTPSSQDSSPQDGAESGRRFFSEVTTGAEMLEVLRAPPLRLKKRQALARLYGLMVGEGQEQTGTIVIFSAAGDADRAAAVALLRRVAVDEVGIAPEELRLAGDAVTSVSVDAASQQAIKNLLGVSALVAFAVALISLRSMRLLVIVFGVSIYCLLLSQSLIYFIDLSSVMDYFSGQMNLVLVVMPVLVYVLAMSAGIHLVNYYRDAASESSLAEAPALAISHGWVPCTLAAGTTAVGVGSLLVSNIQPVRDFGGYAAVGILASLAVLFLLLPASLKLFDRMWIFIRRGKEPDWPPEKRRDFDTTVQSDRARPNHRYSEFVIRHHGTIALIGVLVLAFFAWGALSIRADLVTLRFFPDDHPHNRDYDWLSQEIGPPETMEIVVKVDTTKSSLDLLQQLELVADIERELREMPEIGATAAATLSFIPLDSIPRGQRLLAKRRLEARTDYWKSVGMLSREGDTQLWRISCRVPSSEEGQGFEGLTKAVTARLEDYLDHRRQQYVDGIRAIPLQAEKNQQKLDAWLDEKRIEFSDQPDEFAAAEVQYQRQQAGIELKKKELLSGLVDVTPGVASVHTGVVPLFYAAQRELFNGLVESFLVAFAFIAILMVIRLRSVRAGLIAMLPNVFPVAAIFGTLGWLGRPIDIGSMMTASVAMGIAVDDTLHFLTWFCRGTAAGKTRREAVYLAYRRCAIPMMQTTAIAGLSLFVFAFSSFHPVSQFGTLMFALLVAALVGDLVLLPALLAGRAGKLFEQAREAKRFPREALPPAAQPRT